MFTIELLESRIAPAAVFVNATTATYTDTDGDLVTVKFTKPVLSASNVADVLETASTGAGDQLEKIDLTQALNPAGTGLTITAKPSADAGDGFASVGYIDALGIDLGAVKIHGDLGRIDAGDSNTATLGLKSLAAASIGLFGSSTQAAGGNDQSNVTAGIGPITITTDWSFASLTVTGGKGSIGAISVGDSMLGVTLSASGAIGAVAVKGSIDGLTLTAASVGAETVGADFNGNIINTTGNAGAIKIGGSANNLTLSVDALAGFTLGHDLTSASITTTNLAKSGLKIGGEVDRSNLTVNGPSEIVSIAGSMNQTMISASTLTSLSIGGSVEGGLIGANTLAKLTIGGNFDGSGALGAAVIDVASIGTAVIHGSVFGGASSGSGLISAENISSLTIGGDLEGGDNPGSGAVMDTGEIEGFTLGKITIGGSIVSGANDGTGTLVRSGTILSESTIKSIVVHGSLSGNSSSNGVTPVIISAAGPDDSAAKTDVAIKSLTIGGSVSLTNILAG
ncbi:MAG TPA: hypothetical protein VGH90_04415, partial [Chthoniobacteraceae bacterium]